jgi:hypothetical protein
MTRPNRRCREPGPRGVVAIGALGAATVRVSGSGCGLFQLGPQVAAELKERGLPEWARGGTCRRGRVAGLDGARDR